MRIPVGDTMTHGLRRLKISYKRSGFIVLSFSDRAFKHRKHHRATDRRQYRVRRLALSVTWVQPKFFEDLQVGDKFVTAGRTVTECDIVHFYMLSGAFEELFTNREFVEKESIFKRRIAQGPLTFLISLGLGVQLGWIHGTVMAFLGIDQLRVPQPVFENDTIHAEIEVIDKRESKTHSDRGVVTTKYTVLNQQNAPVLYYNHAVMIRRRQAE
jgi:acyl dehydratase